MRKSPPFLKLLAERRARAAGEVEHRRNYVKAAVTQLESAQATLDAIDAEILSVESRLDPADIFPIKAHNFYAGFPRGALKQAITAILKSAWPQVIDTTQIAREIEDYFQLAFPSYEARWHWRNNSIGRAMRVLFKDGVVERLHEPISSGVAGRWRWKSGVAPSPDRLRELVEAQGAEVRVDDVDHA